MKERKPNAPATARSVALQVLRKWEEDASYSNLALDAAIRRNPGLSEADRALLTTLVYGVLEKTVTLDYYLEQLSDRPPHALDADVRRILRLGLYQLCFLDRIPDHAAINETVDLATRKTSGFVNAVLRSYTRKRDTLTLPPQEEPLRRMSVEFSVPEPLCRALSDWYGTDRARAVLAALSTPTGLTLRVNTLRTDRSRLLEQFASVSPDAAPTPLSPDGIHLPGGSPAALPGFDEGCFFVQDEASQLCVCALDPQPGDRMLDVCACPGSKSFGAAIRMEDRGELIACDLHENKLSLVRDGAERLGLTLLKTRAQDGRVFRPEWENAFDRVLCDVPCSGFGILAKKPEIRYKDPAASAALPAIQAAILATAARYVKPGGTLVYSTCTLCPAENEDNVRAFLAAHPDFSPVPFAVGDFRVPDGMRTLFPDETGTDGFFIARLRRAP